MTNDGAHWTAGRMQRLRAELESRGLAGLLITDITNIRWATGFTGSHAFALVTPEEAWLAVDSRYTVQAQSECPGMRLRHLTSSAADNLVEMLSELAVEELAIESDRMTVAAFLDYEKRLEGKMRLRPESGLIRKLRLIKDDDELAHLRHACRIVNHVFECVCDSIVPGISERDLMLDLEWRIRKDHGAEIAFPSIAVSGPRSAMPHGQPSERLIQPGDFVTLDFGARWRGYCSDITRTIIIGPPDAAQQEVYGVVQAAQRNAVNAIKPGIAGKDIDAVAREYIANAGYGDRFGHGLGHSIGLEVHDGPGLAATSDVVLEPGMVLTVEPGIYIPEWGGVRIEDDVLVTPDGHEALTQAEHDLIVL